MKIADGILKDWNAFVDGVGYAGQVDTYTPPPLTIAQEDYRAAGMDAPIAQDMGMEKLTATLVFKNMPPEIVKRFGLVKNAETRITMRGSRENFDGTGAAEVHNLRGRIFSATESTWQRGESTYEIGVELHYLKQSLNGDDLVEIDVLNMVRVIGGVDQLADRRKRLGM